jgi:phospholipase/lecithinase/hemolysin
MRRALALWLSLAVGLLLARPAHADQLTQIVVFGDSLSDVGNLYVATSGLKPGAPYYQGRFSNGPIWVEQLAGQLGLAAPTPSLLNGSDYAFAGATTGSQFDGGKVPNINNQVAQYLAGHKPTASELFTVWGGANDFFNGQTDPSVPVQNLGDAITTLAQAGAKRFVVPNLPLIGHTPYGFSLTPGGPVTAGQLDALSAGYNLLLDAELKKLASSLKIDIAEVDTAALLVGAQLHPAQFGFTNVTGQGKNAPDNGSGYLFWDDVHPTTAGHGLIANAAVAAVTPEPSSLLLAVSAGVGSLALWRRRNGPAA